MCIVKYIILVKDGVVKIIMFENSDFGSNLKTE